ncbi:MAG: LmbE family N-acetylglucosaminyl deacetylase/GT2 family glycosyltransferase [Planctomycetota bacterium]
MHSRAVPSSCADQSVKALYPPLGDPHDLPRNVLVFAPHPDDEIFGCGGMLAWHAEIGARLRVVIVSDGAAGDPDANQSDIANTRMAEARAGAEMVGLGKEADYRFLGLPDGKLGDQQDLVERLVAEIEEFDPELIYGPSVQELHPDHRALAQALCLAAARGKERRLLLYDVNLHCQPSILFDITPVFERKRAAAQRLASQLAYQDLVQKGEAFDASRTVNTEDSAIKYMEGYTDISSKVAPIYARAFGRFSRITNDSEATMAEFRGWPATTAVISTWNKVDVLRDNLDSLRAQTLPFEEIVVVDNASSDGSAEMVAAEYPEVRLVRMPHSQYGACETFNIGFASAMTPLIAILDDDITLPPRWLEMATERMQSEPESTAVVSTEIIEPGMPEEVIEASKAAGRRYMSTFRGCGSLAKREVLERAGFYDERLFIYGNERDLTCRLLNLGYRVCQDPAIETFHKTPFGIQMGKRSLFFHARNAFLSMLKYAPLGDLVRLPWLVVTKVLLRSSKSEAEGSVTDATGTIGIGRSVRETPGAFWVLCKAGFSVLWNVPYCLKHRAPVKHADFELPLG